MSDIKTVQFNELPLGARERFVAITNGTAGPQPSLSQRTSTKSKVIGLIFLFLLLGVIALVALVLGFGDHTNELGLHGPLYVLLVYVPVAFLVLLVLLTIVTRLVVRSPFPFQPGRYLFLSDFVDARTGNLRIIPTAGITDLRAVHMHTNGRYTHTLLTLVFQGATEQFSVNGQDAAQQAVNAFWEGRRALSQAAQSNDWQTVERLDPFFECRRSGWQVPQPGGPSVKSVPPFFRYRAVVAAIVGLLLVPIVALARNFISDEMMFSSAKSADSEYGYGEYIDNGWRHADEAKLAQPVAAFREAKAKGTVSEMRRVLKAYPGSSVEADAKKELHGLYVKTLADFKAKASTTDIRMLPFMERLLAYMEKEGTSTVRVVFTPPTSSTLADADEYFQQKYSGAGRTVEPISAYFSSTSSEPREQEIVSKLNTAFASIFPTDVLTLQKSTSSSGDTSKDPSIEISYSVDPSGDAYGSDDGTKVFVGIDVAFGMRMAIPQDERSFNFDLVVTPPDRFLYNYNPGENQAAAAYNAMAQQAFAEFTTKLQAVFFKSPAKS